MKTVPCVWRRNHNDLYQTDFCKVCGSYMYFEMYICKCSMYHPFLFLSTCVLTCICTDVTRFSTVEHYHLEMNTTLRGMSPIGLCHRCVVNKVIELEFHRVVELCVTFSFTGFTDCMPSRFQVMQVCGHS